MMDMEVPEMSRHASQQAMELIDILWRQDVDLGARREVFDYSHRQKEHELQRRREQEQEKERQRLREEEKALLAQLQLDEETGEYIPRPPLPAPAPQTTANPLANVNFPEGEDSMSFDECMQLLAETFPLVETVEHSSPACLVDTAVAPDISSSSNHHHILMSAKQPALPPPPAHLAPITSSDRRAPEVDQAWMELWSLPEFQHCLNLQMEETLETTAYLPTSSPDAQDGSYTFYPMSSTTSVGPNPVDTCPATFMSGFEEVYADMVPPEPMMENGNLGAEGFCDPFYPNPVLAAPEGSVVHVMEHKHGGTLPELPKKPPLSTTDLPGCSPDDAMERYKQEPAVELPDSDSGISANTSPHASSPEKSVYGDGSLGFSDSDMEELDINPGSAESDYSEMFTLNFQPDDFQQNALMLSQSSPPLDQQPDKKPKAHASKPVEDGGEGEAPFTKDKQKRRSEVRLSRDEQRARALQIPFTVDMIINLPVDDFNELMSKHQLSEAQLALVRDIRRRGKNKVAAQNCRKRKMENIVGLESELDSLKDEKERQQRQRSQNSGRLWKMKQQLSTLYLEVFGMLKDEEGKPYSPSEYSLQQTTDGSVFLVPRTKKSHVKNKEHKLASAD
ncbi:hypothetical protein CRUP_038381 [Coryphaenoides rupestris]|nr:hypothetical protein CRUP_038381 [Coryphaenoides rupestris]